MLATTAPGLAAGGVLEINHTCATATGCFPGDVAGFPVTITQTGSYRLSSNLIVPDHLITAVSVSAHDVSIDLGGFAIARADCVPPAGVCTTIPGSGDGVRVEEYATNERYLGISLRNGTIAGLGGFGLWAGDQAEVSGVLFRRNNSSIRIRYAGRIQDNVFDDSRHVSPRWGSIVSRNVASQGGSEGLTVRGGSVVTHNTVFDTLVVGIRQTSGSSVDGGSVLLGNTAYNNGNVGIGSFMGFGVYYSVLSDNTAYGNAGDGIAGNRSLVIGNTTTGNGGYGLAGWLASFRENVINGNTVGTVSIPGGIDLGANSCSGTASCP